MMLHDRKPGIRRRSGISLIEVVVACTLLAVTLTALTGLSARMAARTRNIGVIEQRTATYFQEVNRIESMPYDSLSNGRFLVTDSVKSGNIWYAWSYTVGAQTFNSNPTSTSSYRDITLTVTPRTTGATAITGVIRRAKPATYNSFNTP
ncbi:MAG: hypothetical protein JWL61_4319 [Gemmatimonadetes bacterium]|jgi:Tfp pilus assembly protein PilV|nr:hypothetical protein [Gemmatimonadota bacterium]